MNRLMLAGCTPQPLGSYLKGLAVLRLVSEQADETARGSWDDDCFVLETTLDRESLIEFFLKRYSPTAVIAPWNGGSGFYPKDRKVGIDAIAESDDSRFALYRWAIGNAQEIVRETGEEKGASKNDEDARRLSILRLCRNRLPDGCVDWLDAAIAISSEGARAFAPILGTGGNEGRLDYTNNFMENVAGLLIAPDKKTPVRALLEQALFGVPTAGLQDISVGQYDPGRAGGFNQGQGISSGAAANPWTAVLTIEGAIAWAGGIYRKQGVAYRSFLCSPFTVRPAAVGYGSGTKKDELTARAEIWIPLWSRPARYCEVRALLREGRAAVDGHPAQNGLEFAQAVASLGVDRGVSKFIRYSLFKRRGDSYVAAPVGEFPVHYRRNADLVREVAPVLEAADRAARGGQSDGPNSWAPLKRAVEEAYFQALLRDGPEPLRDAAAAMGRAYEWFLTRGRGKYFPARLSPDWITRCVEWEPSGAEVRIAAALASLTGRGAGPIRENLDGESKTFSWTGRDLSDRMLATLRRRVLAGDAEGHPLYAEVEAWPEDVTRFLDGDTDDELIEALLFAFCLVREKVRFLKPEDGRLPWPAYCLLKHLFLPRPIESDDGTAAFAPDLAIPTLLTAGRISEAVAIAQRRLRIAGFQPIRAEFTGGLDARRLGASLLIPVVYTKNLGGPVLASTARASFARR